MWYYTFLDIAKRSGGKYWLFFDPAQEVDNTSIGLPAEAEFGFARYPLTQCLRNGRNIARHAGKYLNHLEQKKYEKILNDISHSFLGEVAPAMFCKSNEELKDKVADLVRQVIMEGYSFGDIAILWSAVSDIPPYVKCEDGEPTKVVPIGGGHSITVGNACHESEDVIVVDSIRRFANLDRPVVILANPQASVYSDKERFLYTAVTRAISKLIQITVRGKARAASFKGRRK